MEKGIMESYIRAGKIGAKIKGEVLKMIKPGMKILEIAEFIEKRTSDLGGATAFPVNIGINDITAHYTPSPGDATVIKEGDLVKIDQGIHVNGYVADMAYTYCSRKNEMIRVVESALKNGIKAVRPGAKIKDISSAINETVQSAGFGVIVNLTGHGLDQYVIHGPPTIHNVKTDSGEELKEGMAIALEPFVCETNGYVKESDPTQIYSFLQRKPVRSPQARKIMETAEDYRGLPFCGRWIVGKGISPFRAAIALKNLETAGAVKAYPTLREKEGRPVVQAEHTVMVKEKPIVTTAT